MNMKEKIAKEIFSPVSKKIDSIQIQTHYEDECWSIIDLINRSSLAEYIKNYKFTFTTIDNHTK